jgi:hypothetical protein
VCRLAEDWRSLAEGEILLALLDAQDVDGGHLVDVARSVWGPQLYKSKGKALKMYIDPKTRDEFLALADVLVDVIFLPEYIESQFSSKENMKARNRFGGLGVVDPLKDEFTYPCLGYKTRHRLDLGASLPLAGAFRELLQSDPKTGKIAWIIDWKQAFKRTADDLYKALTSNLAVAKSVSSLGSDPAYWTTAANVILRVKSEMLQGTSGICDLNRSVHRTHVEGRRFSATLFFDLNAGRGVRLHNVIRDDFTLNLYRLPKSRPTHPLILATAGLEGAKFVRRHARLRTLFVLIKSTPISRCRCGGHLHDYCPTNKTAAPLLASLIATSGNFSTNASPSEPTNGATTIGNTSDAKGRASTA